MKHRWSGLESEAGLFLAAMNTTSCVSTHALSVAPLHLALRSGWSQLSRSFRNATGVFTKELACGLNEPLPAFAFTLGISPPRSSEGNFEQSGIPVAARQLRILDVDVTDGSNSEGS